MAEEGLSEELIASVGLRLAQIEQLLDYAKRADQIHSKDQREWARTMIRSLSDIAQDADQMASLLSANAVHYKVLTVSQAAEAALVSRTAIYNRVSAHFDE